MRLRDLRDMVADLHGRSVLVTLIALAALGAVAAAAVVGFGLYNVSARKGHLPPVHWALHTTFKQSVKLHAPDDPPHPDLSDPGLIELGARHFDRACKVCHAAPGQLRSATTRAMNPEPPPLSEAVGDWSAGELWWIVHEGVKMSGMPGWPSPREDEVWPVVAFLTAVQRGMTAQTYDRLTAVTAPDPDGVAWCEGCHGEGGVSRIAPVPRLDILSADYMTLALRAYRRGARDSGIMEHAATEMPEAELAAAAAHFARAGVDTGPGAATDPDLARAGRDLAYAATARVPACRACHGPWDAPLDRLFPALAGQHESYLTAQLRLWRDGARGGGPAAELMHDAARNLSDADIAALSAWYAGLPAARLEDTRD